MFLGERQVLGGGGTTVSFFSIMIELLQSAYCVHDKEGAWMPEVTSMRYNVRGTLLTKCTILINRVKPQSCTGAFIQIRTAGKSSDSTPQLGMGAIRQDQTRHRLTRRLVEIGRGSLRRSATRSSGEHAAETWNVCRD